MSIGKVSFGQAQAQVQTQQPKEKSSGIISDTATVGSIGVLVGGGLNYLEQKSIIKNPDKYINVLKKQAYENIKEIRKTKGHTKEAAAEVINVGKKAFADIKAVRDFAKAGKIDWGSVGKQAGKIGIYAAGIYLAYRGIKAGIKSLFSSDKA